MNATPVAARVVGDDSVHNAARLSAFEADREARREKLAAVEAEVVRICAQVAEFTGQEEAEALLAAVEADFHSRLESTNLFEKRLAVAVRDREDARANLAVAEEVVRDVDLSVAELKALMVRREGELRTEMNERLSAMRAEIDATIARLEADHAAWLDAERRTWLNVFTHHLPVGQRDIKGIEHLWRGGAALRGAQLAGVNLSSMDLAGVDLSDTNLQGANLSGANLRGANLREANLREGANLRGANLAGADLSGADLRSMEDKVNRYTTCFDDTDITDVVWTGAIFWGKVEPDHRPSSGRDGSGTHPWFRRVTGKIPKASEGHQGLNVEPPPPSRSLSY
jgi:hypothetical protein